MQSGQLQRHNARREQPTTSVAEVGPPSLRRRGFVCSCLGLLGGAQWLSEDFRKTQRNDGDAIVGLLVTSDEGLLLRNDVSDDSADRRWRIPSSRMLIEETPEDAAIRIATSQAGLSSCRVVPVTSFPIRDLPQIAAHIRLMRTDTFEVTQTPESDLRTQFFSRNSCEAMVRDGQIDDFATALGILTYVCSSENTSDMRADHFRNDPIW